MHVLERILPGQDEIFVENKTFQLEPRLRKNFPALALKQIEDAILEACL